jgi:NAD(P)-dependent dehydrogenase (short-subunit alcohol dehydrogenase family)
MNDRKRFDNKHVLITGGARGIGFEIAKQFLSEGAVVSLVDSHEENLSAAAKQLTGISAAVYSYCIDISFKASVTDVVARQMRLSQLMS